MPTVLNLILLLSSFSHAAPKWSACTPKQPCVVEEKNATFLVTLVTEETLNFKTASTVEIANKATGAKQIFKVEDVNTINLDEDFELDRVTDLRPGRAQDLALLAYLSVREEKSFYYFLYDQRTRQFVVSNGTLPKLHLNAKKNVFITKLQQQPFRLKSNLQFEAVPSGADGKITRIVNVGSLHGAVTCGQINIKDGESQCRQYSI